MSLSTGLKAVISLSSNNTLPFVGFNNPDTIFNKVVLPHPEGPKSAYAPPSYQSILTSLRAQSALLCCFSK